MAMPTKTSTLCQHSPSPWASLPKVFCSPKAFCEIYSADDCYIARAPLPYNKADIEGLANIRLIEAAPDLLDATRKLLHLVELLSSGKPTDFILLADATEAGYAALTKANNGVPVISEEAK